MRKRNMNNALLLWRENLHLYPWLRGKNCNSVQLITLTESVWWLTLNCELSTWDYINLCSEVSECAVSECGNKRHSRKENEGQMLKTSSTVKIWDRSNAKIKNAESIKWQRSNVIAPEQWHRSDLHLKDAPCLLEKMSMIHCLVVVFKLSYRRRWIRWNICLKYYLKTIEKERKGEKQIDFKNLQRKAGKLHTKLSIVVTSMSGIGGSEFYSYFLNILFIYFDIQYCFMFILGVQLSS